MKYKIQRIIDRREIEHHGRDVVLRRVKREMAHELANGLIEHIPVIQSGFRYAEYRFGMSANILSDEEILDAERRGYEEGKCDAKKQLPYGMDEVWE